MWKRKNERENWEKLTNSINDYKLQRFSNHL
jgi:hypothetical protein